MTEHSHDEIRRLILTGKWQSEIVSTVKTLHELRKWVVLKIGPVQQSSEPDAVQDVVWQLVREGVLLLQYQETVVVTSYGKRVVGNQGDIPTPHDQSTYMQWLNKACPQLDSVTREYVIEALATFQSRNQKATVVMIGVAAESVFLRVVDGVSAALAEAPARQKKFDDECRTVKRMHDALMKQLEPLKSRLPDPLNETVIMHVEYLYDVIRRYRNDVGHPKGITLDERYEVFTILSLFPMYCRTAHQLMDWMKINPI